MFKKILLVLFCVVLLGCGVNDQVNVNEEDSKEVVMLEEESEEMIETEVVETEEVTEAEVVEEIDEELVILKTIRVLIGALNARSDSTLDSEVMGAVYFNEIYDVFEMDKYEDWYKVKLKTGDFVWISGWYCSDVEYLDESSFVPDAIIIEILNDTADLLEENNLDSDVLHKVLIANRYEVLETYLNDDGKIWYKINADTITGWVQGKFCREYTVN